MQEVRRSSPAQDYMPQTRERSNTEKSSGAGHDSAVLDRRRTARVTHRSPFHLRPMLNDGVGAPVLVVLQDLSSTGLGVIHSQPMQIGEQYQLPLARGAAEALSLICTVKRCEQMDDDLYAIGFEFNSSPSAIDAGAMQLSGKPAPRPEH